MKVGNCQAFTQKPASWRVFFALWFLLFSGGKSVLNSLFTYAGDSVEVNEQKVNDKGTMLGLGEEHLVQVGKRKFAKITIA